MWPIRDPGSAHGGQARLKPTNSKQHGTNTGPSWNPCRGQAHVKPHLSAHMGPELDPHGAHHGLTQVGPQQWVQAGRPCWSHIGPTLPTWVPAPTTGQNLLGPHLGPSLASHVGPTSNPPPTDMGPTSSPPPTHMGAHMGLLAGMLQKVWRDCFFSRWLVLTF